MTTLRPEDFFEQGKLYRFTEQWKSDHPLDQPWRDPYMKAVWIKLDVTLMFLHMHDGRPPFGGGPVEYAWFLIGDQILGCIMDMSANRKVEGMLERVVK